MTESTSEFQEESLGPLLKKSREALGLDLNSLADQTKLPRPILFALEGEDYSKLPAPPYVRSFLSTLGKDLNLDPAMLIKLYEKKLPKRPTLEPSPSPFDDTPEEEYSKKKILFFTLSALLFLVIFLSILRTVFKSDSTESAIFQDEIEDISPQAAVLDTQILAEDSKDSLSDSGEPKTEEPPQEVKPKVRKAPKRALQKPPTKIDPSVNKTVVRFLCLADSVWLSANRTNEEPLSKMLYKDETWMVTHNDTIHVHSGVIEGLEVTVNGTFYRPKSRRFIIFKNILVD